MKLTIRSFGDDYDNNDVGVGFRKNGKKTKNARLRKGLKRRLSKARRAEARIYKNAHHCATVCDLGS